MKNWHRDWTLMSVFFNGDEIASITGRLKNLKAGNLVFCSFESRFAKAGGLASVTTNILPYLKEVNRIPNVLLMSPYFPNIMKKSKLVPSGVSFNVPFGNKSVSAELFEYTWKYKQPARGSLKEYYLKADGFFKTGDKLKNPYIYIDNDKEKNSKAMDENAMFFCKAVPYALNSLGIKKDIVLHLHEWQTALIALTAKKAMVDNILHSCGTVQTIHNSFDSSVPWELLANVDDKANKLKLTGFTGDMFSAYQIGLQLVDAPVTTVSGNFARELTSDVLQSKYYAPHLQNILVKNKTAGVNNGMFTEFSRDFPKRENHTISEIQKIKLKKRKALLHLLSVYRPVERFGELTYQNRSITRLPVSVPIIVMSGRLDPVQKGYDILLQTIERFSADQIKVILAPMPLSTTDLDYFYETACKCKGNVTVFPMRMERGYYELQTGSTFGIMPSIYEPFGAAVEYMASGTVNIGRSTGGLIDQIDKNCGFLYKEDPVYYTVENIKSFIESADIVQERKANPLAKSMAEKLYGVLVKAIDMYQNDPDTYYKMIINGFAKARKFNWEINAKRYNRIYRMISKA